MSIVYCHFWSVTESLMPCAEASYGWPSLLLQSHDSGQEVSIIIRLCCYSLNLLPLTLTLIYILVVGQFGPATGSGVIAQSNVHTYNESCPPINNVHAPLPKSWSTQTRLEP